MRKSSKLHNRLRLMTGVLILFAVLAVGLEAFSITGLADSAGKVTATSAKIRKEPSTSSDTVGGVEQNAAVSVKGQTTGSDGYTWYQVSVDGITGYIRSDLMEITDGSTPASLVSATTTTTTSSSTPTTSTPDETVVDVTEVEPVSGSVTGGSPVRVRQNASTTSRIVSTAQSGLALTITGTATGTDGKDWYQVSFTSGSSAVSGFIRADYVSVNGDLVPAEEASDTPETSDDPEEAGSEPEEETKAWETYYEGEKWHLLDNETGNAYDIEQIFASVEANTNTLNETIKSNKTQQIIMIILFILLVVLAAVISFLIFKLKDMTDSAYFEEVERETVRRRTADRPVDRPQNRQRVMQTVGAEKKRPAGAGGSGQRPVSQRPAGSGDSAQRTAGQRPAGAGGSGQRPAGQRPAGSSGSGQRPAGQRPAGSSGSGQRPAGQRPAGSGDSAQRTAGQRPAGAGGNAQRPAGQRPAGSGDSAQRTTGQRPAGAGGNAQRPVSQRPAGRRPEDSQPHGGQGQLQRGAQTDYAEYEPAYEADEAPEVQAPEEIPAQTREKAGWKSRNFADDDEFEFQFLDWDGDEQR